ncbi:MAG: hypothetical protein NC548_39800 [Lachnospiraceae bacterium]|nr:hypothetical protein [Lachnospiraceae bacterium]MCM1440998.1 hypothetical protein [Roseburia sp.]
MYIAIYDENKTHITNVDNATYDSTVRVYDLDSFTAEGVNDVDINDAKIAVLNDDAGNYKYACFADEITPENNKRKIKGLDFKTLWDTEILLDFTADGSFDGRLSKIFERVKAAVFDGADAAIRKIPVEVVIPTDNTDTTETYGSLQGTYQFVNAYKFLKCYLKYYEYNIESFYNVAAGKIVFTFVKCNDRVAINLSDFLYELTTTSATTNKAVATIKYNVETPETDADGNIIYTATQKTDDAGNLVYNDDGTPVYIPKYKPRPATLATVYYYRNKDNDIVQADASGNIAGRLYPVKAKYYESEYLADAQFNAVNELANARYVDNIIIDNNVTLDPLDFSSYRLYTKVDLYYDGKLYKTLPISEKITTLSGSGESTKIKLGFKKILLTEIIKA